MCNYYTCCVNLHRFCVNFTNILRKFLHTLCNLYIRTTQIYIHTLRKNVHTLRNCTVTVCKCLHIQFVKFCVVIAHIVCDFSNDVNLYTHRRSMKIFTHTTLHCFVANLQVMQFTLLRCDLHIICVYNVCPRKCGFEFFGQISCLYS